MEFRVFSSPGIAIFSEDASLSGFPRVFFFKALFRLREVSRLRTLGFRA